MNDSAPTIFAYQRSLDGVRGMAILLVLIVHGGVWVTTGLGFLAVNTFFVLSGFLITGLLVAEFDKTGSVVLSKFYLRRCLRLLPALVSMLVAFLTFSCLTDSATKAIDNTREAVLALFFVTNWAAIFKFGGGGDLAHTWSLSVEEQFYAVWPALLLFLLRRQARNSLLYLICLGIFLCAMARVMVVLGTNADYFPELLTYDTFLRIDSLMCGAAIGVLWTSNLLRWQINSVLVWLAALGMLALGVLGPNARWMLYIGWLLESALGAVLIAFLVAGTPGAIHRFFESRPLVYLGKISYGLYVWHFPVLWFMRHHQLPWTNLRYLFPVFLVSFASYHFIEKPFLKVKQKFQQG